MYRFRKTLKQVFNNPTLLNTLSSNNHEKSFEQILIFEGISTYSNYSDLNDNIYYTRHPFGQNKFPDFSLYFNNYNIQIELKKSTKRLINIGSTWIKPNAIYIISYDKKTFISLGKDMVTEQDNEMFKEYSNELREMKHKYNKDGISLYPRTNIIYPLVYSKQLENYNNVISYINSL
jgi:hypothetical protein